MSVVDCAEQGGTSDSPDISANDEERYRLKIAVLQEYYDAVALQTLRIRERIYQVRKQCRRLEAMKRVALNMLHQNTGTYEIPPLEIIDEGHEFYLVSTEECYALTCKMVPYHLQLFEDPAPSFLESVHRQLHAPPETPRKKSKRPSRRKAGGKLTPEEEERAKQKICSIIDSVYSETAKRMGDTPKRPMRSVNVTDSLSQCDLQKKPRRLFSIGLESEEGSKKTGSSKTAAQQTSDDDSRPRRSSTRFNEHPEAYMEEAATEKPSMGAYGEANSDASIEITYNSLPPKLHMQYHPVEGTSNSINCHNMAPSFYRQGTDKAQSYGVNPVNPVYDTSLNANQPVEYIDGEVTPESSMSNTGPPMNCTLLQGAAESSAIYANAVNGANTSATMSCNENLNPAAVVDYTEDTPVMPVSMPAFTPAELMGCSDKAVERNEAKSVVGFCDKKDTAGATVVNKAIPAMSTDEGKASPNKSSCKQKTPSKALSKGPPPPNFIPYRMIAVENARLLELATNASSSGKPSLPKPSPKRRRKYKYVVESVLDNVPYTFRQTESDDDEYTEKNSLSANRSHN